MLPDRTCPGPCWATWPWPACWWPSPACSCPCTMRPGGWPHRPRYAFGGLAGCCWPGWRPARCGCAARSRRRSLPPRAMAPNRYWWPGPARPVSPSPWPSAARRCCAKAGCRSPCCRCRRWMRRCWPAAVAPCSWPAPPARAIRPTTRWPSCATPLPRPCRWPIWNTRCWRWATASTRTSAPSAGNWTSGCAATVRAPCSAGWRWTTPIRRHCVTGSTKSAASANCPTCPTGRLRPTSPGCCARATCSMPAARARRCSTWPWCRPPLRRCRSGRPATSPRSDRASCPPGCWRCWTNCNCRHRHR